MKFKPVTKGKMTLFIIYLVLIVLNAVITVLT